MRPRFLLLMLTTLLFSASVATATALSFGGAHKARHHAKHRTHSKGHKSTHHKNQSVAVRTIPVSFTVVNDNETAVPCLPDNPDGKTYQIQGNMILPADTTP